MKLRVKRLVYSVLRVAPAAAIGAIIGCFFGYFVLNIPLNDLGVVVAVPLVMAFLLTRLLVLPRRISDEPPAPRPSKRSMFAASSVFVSGSAAMILLVSAPVFQVLGMHHVSVLAFKGAGIAAGVALFFFALCWIAAWAMSRTVHGPVQMFTRRVEIIFWDILRTPRAISELLSGHHGHRVSHIP